jgi:hypothetical protein
VIFRLSQKVSTKIKAGTLPVLPSHDNPFTDWSANLFLVDRTQYIILSNTKTLYSTVLFGKGISNDSHFIERALSNIRELMTHDGYEAVYRKHIVPTTGTVYFAKALDRIVTGSMNEQIKHAKYLLADGDMSPFHAGFELNGNLLSILGDKPGDYGKPKDAFKEMAGEIDPLRRSRRR